MIITLADNAGEHIVTIRTRRDDLNVQEVVEELMRPAFIAYGYHPKNIADLFNDEE